MPEEDPVELKLCVVVIKIMGATIHCVDIHFLYLPIYYYPAAGLNTGWDVQTDTLLRFLVIGNVQLPALCGSRELKHTLSSPEMRIHHTVKPSPHLPPSLNHFVSNYIL